MLVHNHFTKKNSSIAQFSTVIINNYNSRAALFQGQAGFVGISNSTSESGDTLTISLEWTTPEARQQVINATNLGTLGSELQDYCLANTILTTRSVT